MPDIREGYARLPEDLLRELLSGAAGVAKTVADLLGPALERREELRSALRSLGLLRGYTKTESRTIAGIDGGFAVERTAAVDLILSVAVGVEGLSSRPTPWGATQYQWWSRADKHDPDSERLARGVMIAQELSVLRKAPHELRILDGSHLTLVIQLNSALTSFSADVRKEARRVWGELATNEALADVTSSVSVVAMPKYDSSSVITDTLGKATGSPVPGDDKHLMSLLLNGGELLVPQRVPADPWGSLHFDARSGDEDLATAFESAILPLRRRELRFTYFKPEQDSPAYRIELKEALDEEGLNALCSTLANQITGPFIREPYPQYLADVMAKSVGLGLSALQSAVQLSLAGQGKPEIAELLIHSYRTEGV